MADKTAGRRAWLGLAVLVLPTLVVALDMNALFLALPKLSADLGAGGTEQLWISDSYGFLMAGFVITMGTLGDRIGRRKLLLTGSAAFIATSVVAAYAGTPEMLIAARVLMGVAGATLMPSTLALISTLFRDDRERGKAISVWATCQFAGAAFSPVFGGFLLQHFWWGSVFLIAVPVMVLLLVTGPFLLPEHRDPAARRIDIVSVALSLAAVLPAVYGIKRLAADGGDTLFAVLSIVVGVAFGIVFARRQLSLADPLIDLRLLRDRRLTAVLGTLLLAGIAMAGVGFLVTQYLQSVLGFSPTESAIVFAPMGLAVAIGTMIAPALTNRVRPGTAIASGLVVSALGGVLLTQADRGLSFVIAGIAVLALGTGPLFALGTGLVIGSAPVDRAGSAASMSETANFFGGALGVAVLGAVAAGIYRGRMGGAAGAARETLAGAVHVAASLPGTRGAELVTAAKGALTSGLTAGAVVAASVFAVGAVLVSTLHRERRTAPEPVAA
ncbi:MFS transporter [Amycolatopsis minnesotensis]|uniref:MFS transporter n=1 Tax=Amycolatopsis minnesotensis TaxID=337894 RepID=A0ABN2RLF3_9PSEU